MKIAGSYVFDAPPDRVWKAITDPDSLQHCIPGCDRMEAAGENRWEASMTVSVGPIRGQFDAKISMTDQDPFNSYKLVVEGSGPSGFVNGEAFISLIPNGETTTVAVEGDSRPGGLLARVGQRMMESVARSTMDRFFACLRESAE